MLKYPNCEICRRLREVLPEDEVPDEIINAYHESQGSYELFPKKWQDAVIDVMLEVGDEKIAKCPYKHENGICDLDGEICRVKTPKECRNNDKLIFPNEPNWRKEHEELNKQPKNDCRYWGENVFPFFDDGCHIGHSFCNPKECDDYQPIELKVCGTCRNFLRKPNRDEQHSYCKLKQIRVHAGESCSDWEATK